MKKTIILILLISFNSCNKGRNSKKQKINECRIENQIWMDSNLNTEKFVNGDLIKESKTNEEWFNATKNQEPSWCYSNNIKKEEKLYNWYAINDKRGLAPKGWKIPNKQDWEKLFKYIETGIEGKALKTKEYGGTNKYGFSAIPTGSRDPKGEFIDNLYAHYWSKTREVNQTAYSFVVNCENDALYKFETHQGSGYSVRCIKEVKESGLTKTKFERYYLELKGIPNEQGISSVIENPTDKLKGQVLKIFKTKDGGHYYLFKLFNTLNYKAKDIEKTTDYLIIGEKFRSKPLTRKSINTTIFIAVVNDNSLIEEEFINFNKATPIGTGLATVFAE